MRRSIALTAVLALAFAVASPALAGEGGKCTQDAQACLNYMAKNMKGRGWAGVELDEASGALVVTKVYDGTPAYKAGVKKGDTLLAVNGIRFGVEENKEQLKALWGQMKPGKTFDYTIDRNGKEKNISVTLAEMPEETIAGMVGRHMLNDHAGVEVAAK